ncbi:hypothetical protein [Sphaerochaeta pleomorpha]|uniref:hypothetical protein n=1 Tax=Sphaerochaeta pleomorpha TaxID=1131707 RepID=UPI0012DFBA4F|nr:hypothetical protein [Sphaerochaeta pleomorpha]
MGRVAKTHIKRVKNQKRGKDLTEIARIFASGNKFFRKKNKTPPTQKIWKEAVPEAFIPGRTGSIKD